MIYVVKKLEERLKLLKNLSEMAEKELETVSLQGRVKVCGKRKYPQFYLIKKPGSRNGKYLCKKDVPIIKAYFQRDYNRSLQKRCQSLIKPIEKFLNHLPPELSAQNTEGQFESMETYLAKESPVRRPYVDPHLLTDEEFAAQWQSVQYKGKSFEEGDSELVTDRGERVRSKSELLIANKLAALGMSYRYEYPLKLKNRFGQKITVYPDFTILNKATRSEILLEHFGRMDDADYVASTMEKLSLYGRNGIFPGLGFLFTTETSTRPFDIRLFEKQLVAVMKTGRG